MAAELWKIDRSCQCLVKDVGRMLQVSEHSRVGPTEWMTAQRRRRRRDDDDDGVDRLTRWCNAVTKKMTRKLFQAFACNVIIDSRAVMARRRNE